MIFNERIILPIWRGVNKFDIYNYSPSLADTFALIWPNKDDLSLENYEKEVEIIISRIHTEINKNNS